MPTEERNNNGDVIKRIWDDTNTTGRRVEKHYNNGVVFEKTVFQDNTEETYTKSQFNGVLSDFFDSKKVVTRDENVVLSEHYSKKEKHNPNWILFCSFTNDINGGRTQEQYFKKNEHGICYYDNDLPVKVIIKKMFWDDFIKSECVFEVVDGLRRIVSKKTYWHPYLYWRKECEHYDSIKAVTHDSFKRIKNERFYTYDDSTSFPNKCSIIDDGLKFIEKYTYLEEVYESSWIQDYEFEGDFLELEISKPFDFDGDFELKVVSNDIKDLASIEITCNSNLIEKKVIKYIETIGDDENKYNIEHCIYNGEQFDLTVIESRHYKKYKLYLRYIKIPDPEPEPEGLNEYAKPSYFDSNTLYNNLDAGEKCYNEEYEGDIINLIETCFGFLDQTVRQSQLDYLLSKHGVEVCYSPSYDPFQGEEGYEPIQELQDITDILGYSFKYDEKGRVVEEMFYKKRRLMDVPTPHEDTGILEDYHYIYCFCTYRNFKYYLDGAVESICKYKRRKWSKWSNNGVEQYSGEDPKFNAGFSRFSNNNINDSHKLVELKVYEYNIPYPPMASPAQVIEYFENTPAPSSKLINHYENDTGEAFSTRIFMTWAGNVIIRSRQNREGISSQIEITSVPEGEEPKRQLIIGPACSISEYPRHFGNCGVSELVWDEEWEEFREPV